MVSLWLKIVYKDDFVKSLFLSYSQQVTIRTRGGRERAIRSLTAEHINWNTVELGGKRWAETHTGRHCCLELLLLSRPGVKLLDSGWTQSGNAGNDWKWQAERRFIWHKSDLVLQECCSAALPELSSQCRDIPSISYAMSIVLYRNIENAWIHSFYYYTILSCI